MMEDKTLVGIQAGYMLPIGAYADDVNGAIGVGLRGKYFGTNTFAFGFDFGFFAPKITPGHHQFITDSLRTALREEQYKGQVDSIVQILDVTATSQYIPFNLSFEFYLPSRSLTNFRPYAGIGLGLNMINRRYKPTYNVEEIQEKIQEKFQETGIRWGWGDTGIPFFEEQIQPSSNRGFISINPTIGFLWTIDELWNINLDLRYNQFLGDQKGGVLSVHVGVILDLSFKYVR
jgi:outer membrane protein W